MSIDHFFRNGPRDPYTRIILMTLADNSNDQGKCELPLRDLASECGVSLSSIQRYLRLLDETGWIEIYHQYDIDGSNLPNVYELNLEKRVK